MSPPLTYEFIWVQQIIPSQYHRACTSMHACSLDATTRRNMTCACASRSPPGGLRRGQAGRLVLTARQSGLASRGSRRHRPGRGLAGPPASPPPSRLLVRAQHAKTGEAPAARGPTQSRSGGGMSNMYYGPCRYEDLSLFRPNPRPRPFFQGVRNSAPGSSWWGNCW